MPAIGRVVVKKSNVSHVLRGTTICGVAKTRQRALAMKKVHMAYRQYFM